MLSHAHHTTHLKPHNQGQWLFLDDDDHPSFEISRSGKITDCISGAVVGNVLDPSRCQSEPYSWPEEDSRPRSEMEEWYQQIWRVTNENWGGTYDGNLVSVYAVVRRSTNRIYGHVSAHGNDDTSCTYRLPIHSFDEMVDHARAILRRLPLVLGMQELWHLGFNEM